MLSSSLQQRPRDNNPWTENERSILLQRYLDTRSTPEKPAGDTHKQVSPCETCHRFLGCHAKEYSLQIAQHLGRQGASKIDREPGAIAAQLKRIRSDLT